MEEQLEELHTKELARLSDWLKGKGFTDDDIVECFRYISDDNTAQ